MLTAEKPRCERRQTVKKIKTHKFCNVQLTAHPNEALLPSALLLLRMTPGLQDQRKASWKLSPGERSKNIASHHETSSNLRQTFLLLLCCLLWCSCCFYAHFKASVYCYYFFNREWIVRNSDTQYLELFCEGGVKNTKSMEKHTAALNNGSITFSLLYYDLCVRPLN